MDDPYILQILQVMCHISFRHIYMNDLYEYIVNHPSTEFMETNDVDFIYTKLIYLVHCLSRAKIYKKYTCVPLLYTDNMPKNAWVTSEHIWVIYFQKSKFKGKMFRCTANYMSTKTACQSFRCAFQLAFSYFMHIIFEYWKIIDSKYETEKEITLQNLCRQKLENKVIQNIIIQKSFCPHLIDIISSKSPILWVDILHGKNEYIHFKYFHK